MTFAERFAFMGGMNSARHDAPYLPFQGASHRLGMGLLALKPEEWIEVDDDFAAYLARKRELLETRHGEVFAARPEAAAASYELLAVLGAHLIAQHGALFEAHGDHLSNKITGESWNIARPALHPLDLAGRLVQEDFCLLLPAGATYSLAAASLCFPSRWRLAEKLGHGLGTIHGPVPGYGERLEAAVDRFLGLLQPGKPVWRLNWFIHDDPSLFQPVRRPSAHEISARDAGDHLWLRVERQTLRRLQSSGAVIFTIRTHLTPLAAAIRSKIDAADLAATIRSMPDAMREYRQTEAFEEGLLGWLDAWA